MILILYSPINVINDTGLSLYMYYEDKGFLSRNNPQIIQPSEHIFILDKNKNYYFMDEMSQRFVGPIDFIKNQEFEIYSCEQFCHLILKR